MWTLFPYMHCRCKLFFVETRRATSLQTVSHYFETFSNVHHSGHNFWALYSSILPPFVALPL